MVTPIRTQTIFCDDCVKNGENCIIHFVFKCINEADEKIKELELENDQYFLTIEHNAKRDHSIVLQLKNPILNVKNIKDKIKESLQLIKDNEKFTNEQLKIMRNSQMNN